MKLIIDRFEGEYAVVELQDKSMVNIPKKILPAEAGEGDIISIVIDKDETEKRKQEIQKLAEDLWE
ncbi:MAG TPA: DUF3006 domain-containing protein [Thermoanaerobacterales bacterium]|nr:DUF3006 domain-containing protein [Thermoanaerobacterales bacterium]